MLRSKGETDECPARADRGAIPAGGESRRRDARRDRQGARRPEGGRRRGAVRAARRRPRAGRRRSRPRQDAARPGACQDDLRKLRAHPVHARPDACRRHRAYTLRPQEPGIHRATRPGVRQPPSCRRDQPRPGQDPGRAAGSDAGGPGDDRGPRPRPRATFHGARDSKPDRAGGHLRAARGAARPLSPQGADRLPDAGRRDRDGAPGHRRQGRRPAGRRAGGSPGQACDGGDAAGDRGAAADRRRSARLRAPPGARHAQLGRRRRGRRHLAAEGGAWRRPPGRPRLRHARRREAHGPARAAPPHPALARARARGPRRRHDPQGTAGKDRSTAQVILPATRLLWLLVALATAAVVVSLYPDFLPYWTTLGGVFVLLAAWDAVAGMRIPAPTVVRQVPGSLALGVPVEVRLRVRNLSGLRLRCEVHDHHPASVECEGLPQPLALAPQEWGELSYPVRPVARGEAQFLSAELRIFSPLRLWQIKRLSGTPSRVRVYPNFRALARYTLLATDNRLSQIGVLQVRRRGEGTEFHQLREYRQGDSQRAIDWKATARTARLIAREYEDEKDQRVLLVLDCGRRMASKDGDLSHFDHTLNSALLLAHVAARQ